MINIIITSIIKNKINKRMDRLAETLKLEKETVDIYIAKDWDMMDYHMRKATSTMRALRKMNKILKNLDD